MNYMADFMVLQLGHSQVTEFVELLWGVAQVTVRGGSGNPERRGSSR